MARLISPQEELEYEELCAFVGAYADKFWGFGPEHPLNPAVVSRASVEMFGKSKALVGLRQATNDMVDGAQDLSPAQVEEFDNELRAKGAVALSELRSRYSRAYRAIRKRGIIRNETEYYLVKTVLDETAPILDPEEAEALGSMLLAFERDQATHGAQEP